MRLDFTVRRRRRISLTSLIDVIFLLLLFFMLSSTFTRFAEVEIAAAGRAGLDALDEQPDILIRLSEEAWTVNGVSFADEEALPELSRLVQAGAKKAVLIVRGEVSSQALVSAVERISLETPLKLAVAR